MTRKSPAKPVSLSFKNLEFDYEANGMEKPDWAPKPGETRLDAMIRVLERMGCSMLWAMMLSHAYEKDPDGEVAQLVDKALSGDGRAKAKILRSMKVKK